MNYEMSHIDSIVERFWNAEASEQEEEILRSLVDNPSFANRHPKTSEYFKALNQYSDLKLPQEQKDQILKVSKIKKKNNLQFFWAAGIAASIALTIWFSIFNNKVEYSDQEINLAYMQTKEALFLVSSKIDEGHSYTTNLKHLDKSQRNIINEIQLN